MNRYEEVNQIVLAMKGNPAFKRADVDALRREIDPTKSDEEAKPILARWRRKLKRRNPNYSAKRRKA